MKNTPIPKILTSGQSPVAIHELPNPKKLGALLGPGVIMFASAIGAGEVYIWPWLIANYSISLLWLGLFSLYFQYVLNTEFARYTLATGETVITGFTRIWKPAGYVFLACSLLPWIWPAWSMGAATIINQHLLPIKFKEDRYAAAALLILTGLILSGTTKVLYKAFEWVQKAQVLFILIAMAILGYFFVEWSSFVKLSKGMVTIPTKIPTDIKDIAFLASAIAFCGAGGTVNLATSNWVREKQLGMSFFVPRLQNLFKGRLSFLPHNGFFFEGTKENLSRWNKWWKIVKNEQLWTFLIIELICIVVLITMFLSLIYITVEFFCFI